MKNTIGTDLVLWEWMAFEYKDRNGFWVTSFLAHVLIKFNYNNPHPVPDTHTHRKEWYNSRQDLPYAELTNIIETMWRWADKTKNLKWFWEVAKFKLCIKVDFSNMV